MTMSSVPITSKPAPQSFESSAREDLIVGLTRSGLWGRIGWLDIKRRYRRTVLGPFWSAATLGIYTLAVGIVGAGLFQQNVREYLPYLNSGMAVWTLVSTIMLESCTLFVAGHALFRNVRFEYSILAYALVWRNFVVFLHNFIIYVLIVLVLNPRLLSPTALLAVPGLVIVLVNGVWVALLVGMVCLRFRDVQPLVQTAIQIAMLITPIFWLPEALSGVEQLLFVQLNPIYRLIDIVRAPLLGQVPAIASYIAALVITIVGWGLTYVTFSYFRKRISYWS
jgi:homopolymeric O-antigen transport system permease protein